MKCSPSSGKNSGIRTISPDEQAARLDYVEERLVELDSGETYFPPEVLSIAGAVIYLDHDGEVGVRRGFIAPEYATAAEAAQADDAGEDAHDAAGALPHSLVESLTTHRMAALALTLSQQPKVALGAVVHALALRAFYGYSGDSCLQIFSKGVSLKLADGSNARSLLEIATESWHEHLPGHPEDLFAWCLDMLPHEGLSTSSR